MMPSDGHRTPIVARRCSERCWKKSFSRVGAAGRCRRKSGTCWIEWSRWWPDYPLFSQSAVLEQRAAPQVAGGERTSVLICLEGSIDELLHEIKLAGGLPEFEATLRQARRILVRNYVE